MIYLTPEGSLPIIPGIFHLTLVFNRGIAFGFFNRHPAVLLALITASLAVLLFLGYRLNHPDRLASSSQNFSRAGLALILGGAIGNWIDRIRYQAVVDFLDFRVWPVFNLADSAITVGVSLYLLLFLKKSRE